jgi:hypothetical protein
MCQPVSPSISSAFHPLDPHTNSHANKAIKKQSEKDGTKVRIQGVNSIAAFLLTDGDTCAGRSK